MKEDENLQIAAWCGLDGVVIEILGGQLGECLSAGQPLAAIIDAGSGPKMLSFIEKIAGSGAALDWKFDIAFEFGVLPLYFSGCRSGSGILIAGFANSRSANELQSELVRMTQTERNSARRTRESMSGAPDEPDQL